LVFATKPSVFEPRITAHDGNTIHSITFCEKHACHATRDCFGEKKRGKTDAKTSKKDNDPKPRLTSDRIAQTAPLTKGDEVSSNLGEGKRESPHDKRIGP
jgi:hypothetical protein